jgi:hypothetical protein
VHVLDAQYKLSEGELLRERIIHVHTIKSINKTVHFDSCLLQRGKEETALRFLLKSMSNGRNLQVVLQKNQ